MTDADLRERVAATARRLAAEGLLIGTAGNVSARSGDRIAVTGTGVVLAECTADTVTEVAPDGAILAGRLRPTSELDLHLGIYRDTQAGAVVHTHAPDSTAVACLAGLTALPVLHYQQLLLGGATPIAPFAPFGTQELAAHVRAALAGKQAALLANHGAVALGDTLEQALDNALLLEWAAALFARTTAMGSPRVLTAAEQAAVVEQAVRLRYGTIQENPDD
ncbi:class II aldolase/adducin family protein [Nocardia sp. NPDC057227]|uniref:class II aldolase/adducin family protein n=1 Tax=Nocardia sp. NPDC057227 TaxID=3346056 RepID=UPI00362A2757